MTCAACEDCPFGIDSKETGVFEIHLTVRSRNVARFEETCLRAGIKPIVIEFQRRTDGETEQQLMTSQRFEGSPADLYAETAWMIAVLEDSGFRVSRTKIETGPADAHLYKVCYFESHFAIGLQSGWQERNLHEVADLLDLHVSKNAFKEDRHGETRMATFRDKSPVPAADFVRKTKRIRDTLRRNNLPPGKVIVEACIYDSNEALDAAWIAPHVARAPCRSTDSGRLPS